VGREALLEALRRVKILARDATPVRSPWGRRLRADGDHPGRRQRAEELDAKYEGTEMTVAFNPDYLPPASRPWRRRDHARDHRRR
jgi:DNA polymerase III subunit beta